MSRILFAVLGLAGISLAATNYPFPYQANYPYGIHSSAVLAATLQKHYTAWKGNYYIESGDKARIMWEDDVVLTNPVATGAGCTNQNGDCTVSEGIGYGMLITVYMDNATNNTQAMFDKLWTYYSYSANLDGNGLMNWMTHGFDRTLQTGAATDADLDVALALCMAYKQWGDAKYQTNAITMLGKIWDREVGSNVFKPDDQGTGNIFNPSYFAVGAARVFGQVDKNHNWASVADGCLSKLSTIQANYSTGLVPDWVDGNNSANDHNGSGTTKFGYDAVRTPWRVALDYLWFGTSSAQTFESKILTWIKGAAVGIKGNLPDYIKMEYNLDGTTTSPSTNAVYRGALVVPAMASVGDTAWLRGGSTLLAGMGTDNVSYFNDCWKILYLLTLSGNFQNFWGTVQPSAIVPSGSRPEASWLATVRPGAVELRGEGAVRAQLMDLSGRILSQTSGVGSASLSRPQGHGVWLVRILGDHPQTLSVVAN